MKNDRITAMLLAASLLAGMTACSAPTDEAGTDSVTQSAAESVSADVSETAAESSEEAVTESAAESTDADAGESADPESAEADTDGESSDEIRTKGEYHTYSDEVDFDLNSDGEKEKILYSVITEVEDGFEYAEISVNDVVYTVNFPTEGYLICDIDPTDKFFEIAVSSTGWSSDYGTEFLHFDNGQLYSIGSVEDSVDGSIEFNFSLVDSFGKPLVLNGDGTIKAAKRLDIFQSWYSYTTHKLNTSTDKLEEIQDMYYPYGEALKDDYNGVSNKIYDENWPASYTSRAVNLYSQPDTTSEAVAFEPQKFAATATDNKNWVYIVGESGASGWLYYDNNNTYDENGQIAEFGDNAFVDAVTGERYIDGFNEEGTYYMDVFCGLLLYD